MDEVFSMKSDHLRRELIVCSTKTTASFSKTFLTIPLEKKYHPHIACMGYCMGK